MIKMSVEEASKYFKRSTGTIRRWIKLGRIQADKEGNKWYVYVEDDGKGKDIFDIVKEKVTELEKEVEKLKEENRVLKEENKALKNMYIELKVEIEKVKIKVKEADKQVDKQVDKSDNRANRAVEQAGDKEIIDKVAQAIIEIAKKTGYYEVRIKELKNFLKDVPNEVIDRALTILAYQQKIDLLKCSYTHKTDREYFLKLENEEYGFVRWRNFDDIDFNERELKQTTLTFD